MTHPFKVVLFPDDDKEALSIDVVPTEWIFDSKTLNSKACHFPKGPFTKSDINRLHKMVKNTETADDSWPIHRVTIHGRAGTYKEACQAADKLQYDRYAFSTDRESSVERRVRAENNIIQPEKVIEKNVQEELIDAMIQLTGESSPIESIKTKNLSQKKKKSPSVSQSSSSDEADSKKSSKDKRKKSNSLKTKKKDSLESVSSSPSQNDSYDSDYKSTFQERKGDGLKKPSVKSWEKKDREENKKATRQSRSRERRPSKIGCRTSVAPSMPQEKQTFTKSYEGPKNASILNRSLSDESSGNSRRRAIRRDIRARSTDSDHSTNQDSIFTSSRAYMPLASVPEDGKIETLESLRQFVAQIYRSLANKIDRLHGALVETDGKLNELIDVVKNKSLRQVGSEDESQDDDSNAIALPVETKEDFYVFDTKLKDDKKYRDKIEKRIRYMVSKVKLDTHNLSVIVRVFLSKNVIRTSFTAVQKTKTKDALKGTSFYGCLLGMHQQILGEKINEKMFQQTLGAVINAAKDWDGGRLQR